METTKIELLLQAVREEHPELRVGQIIVNAAKMGGWNNDDVFYCPDITLTNGLCKMLHIDEGENKNEFFR